jgi:hypothetical protein
MAAWPDGRERRVCGRRLASTYLAVARAEFDAVSD